ncbi:hypothetical protein ARMGADRAFT_1037003 [Armillaria gallica]|uniref:Peptidase C14 caspase domain-containing protein n=1 Tax=Armillaria gallica TaxID=47427 RepID=A0A2H3CN35_ARMGA|nr:hypothetical protein ARMGADRAFT_1037003 [Armillaria gallica]
MPDSESQPMSEDHRKAAHCIDASRIWAVLIGINAYPSSSNCSPLRGCMNDIEKMEEFLTKDLGVPEGHIQSSYDLEASGFFEADDISAVGSIEALCPMDRRTASATDLCIPDISDQELNTILAEISHEKGNHITLILDCCHSSGASRDANEPLNVAHHALSFPTTLIKDMFDTTDTRLKSLQKSDDLKEESSYVDLIRASKMPPTAMQTPVIAGNASARLWYQPKINKKVSPWYYDHAAMLALLLGGVGVVSIACQ